MHFTNSYITLGEHFFEKSSPTPVPKASLFLWNDELAEELHLAEKLNTDQQTLAEYFSGNRPLPETPAIALAYAGHQFGNFVPQLGDGRAHLIGETLNDLGQRLDIQLKGSGQTAFSRNGDGRCALGPAIREFIMSEALYALQIPTARTLAVVTTGEDVYREAIQPGAIVTRVASSHIRVGSFEYFAARKNYDALESLCDFAIERHYPELKDAGPARFELLIENVMNKQVHLVTEWLRVGFIHGVMNTDNFTISGETIDFGPCAMMGNYDLDAVFSSIDRQGRYAYGNQPTIAQWNLARFAETLIPLLDENENIAIDKATQLISGFPDRFQKHYLEMMAGKTGLNTTSAKAVNLISDLRKLLEDKNLDYTITFNRLTQSISSEQAAQQCRTELGEWYDSWRETLDEQSQTSSDIQQKMRTFNPVVIPRNHHVEQVIQDSINTKDNASILEFMKVLKQPYKMTDKTLQYQDAFDDRAAGYQTFCGT